MSNDLKFATENDRDLRPDRREFDASLGCTVARDGCPMLKSL